MKLKEDLPEIRTVFVNLSQNGAIDAPQRHSAVALNDCKLGEPRGTPR
jgi:hypothetical protein